MSKDYPYEVEYMGGHPDWLQPCKIVLKIISAHKNILLRRITYQDEVKMLLIDTDEIISIDLEDKQTRSLGKAAAGAIIGGILTGGIGLLAGGAIGGSKKNLSNIFITIDYDGKPFRVILKTGKFTNEIYGEICSLFSV